MRHVARGQYAYFMQTLPPVQRHENFQVAGYVRSSAPRLAGAGAAVESPPIRERCHSHSGIADALQAAECGSIHVIPPKTQRCVPAPIGLQLRIPNVRLTVILATRCSRLIPLVHWWHPACLNPRTAKPAGDPPCQLGKQELGIAHQYVGASRGRSARTNLVGLLSMLGAGLDGLCDEGFLRLLKLDAELLA